MTYYCTLHGDDYQPLDAKPYTLGRLMELCNEFPDSYFTFIETECTVGDLHSWRGNYEIPALTYEHGRKIGSIIYAEISEALKEAHFGWKGGEYKFSEEQEFYLSHRGMNEEYVVVGYSVVDDDVILLTAISPY